MKEHNASLDLESHVFGLSEDEESAPVTGSYEVIELKGRKGTGRFVRVDAGDIFMPLTPRFGYVFRHPIPLPSETPSNRWRYILEFR